MRDAELIGVEIARRYRLLVRLGEGPLGVSFLAKGADDAEVVVKLIERSRVSEEAISHFIQASLALATLGGPHLVRTLDIAHDLERGLLVIVRERMRGLDVATLLRDAAPIEPRGAVVLVAQASAAVASAHAAGVILRGIKPTNVFLEPDGGGDVTIRVCDPAIVVDPAPPGRDAGSSESSAYVAPELASRLARPEATDDVYGLGALLYALLTGVAPVRDAGAAYPALHDRAPWVGSDVAQIVAGALAANPAGRTTTAAALRDALRDAAGGDLALRAPMLASITAAVRSSRPPPSTRAPEPSPRAGRGDPLLGHKLGGRYLVVRVLGHGGMGSVYEVSSVDGSTFAAKVITGGEGARTQLMARFLREAQAARRIVDPHVVRTVELGTDMTLGAPFIIMELLRGRDLTRVLGEHGALDPIVALRLFLQAARGLAAAHACGVVHRDIKPANLFLGEDQAGAITVKICDFGLAKAMERSDDAAGAPRDLTRDGLVLGTPTYMSPEQAASSREVDARSDIWSLCASLYEALSGRRLWAEHPATGAELLHVICTGAFRRLDRIAPWLDPAHVAIVHRGLERERRARFPDARALIEALEAAVSGTESVTLDEIRPVDPVAAPGAAVPAREQGFSTTGLAGRPIDDSTQAIEQSVPPLRTPGSEVRPASPHPEAASPPVDRRGVIVRRAALVGGALALAAGLGFLAVNPPRGTPEAASTSSAPTVAAAASAACVSNAACRRELGRAAICRAEQGCVALETDECVVRGPDGAADNDATIWIGTMFPKTGDGVDTLWGPAARTVELAVKDFNEILGGIPDPRPAHPARPLALVACDDSDEALGARSARHLLDDVHVPAIIGFRSSKEVIDLATAELIPRGVLGIATFNKSSLITSIPHPAGSPRLVWRIAPSNAQDAAPLSRLISEILEPEIRTAGLGPRAPMRVAVVRPDSRTGIGFEDGLLSGLRFNGKRVGDNDESFREIVFDERSATPLEGVVSNLLSFQPHVVAYIGDAVVSALPEAIERGWPAANKLRPRYVFGGPLLSASLYRLVEQRPQLARRLTGISTPARTLANIKLAAHYNHAFAAEETAITTMPAAYDAIYLAAYAAIAAGESFADGASLARGVERLLPPGESLEASPARILDGYNALRTGNRIDLDGASGPLDFDTATGEAQFDYVFLCVAPRAGRAQMVETGLRFDLKTHALAGTLTCAGGGP